MSSFLPVDRKVEKFALRGYWRLVVCSLAMRVLMAGFLWLEAACANAEKKTPSTSLWKSSRLGGARCFDPWCLPFALKGEVNANGQRKCRRGAETIVDGIWQACNRANLEYGGIEGPASCQVVLAACKYMFLIVATELMNCQYRAQGKLEI